MAKPLIIKCVHRPVEMRLTGVPTSRQGGKYFQLHMSGSEFEGQSFELRSRINAYDPRERMVEFFEELAADSGGWDGVKHWESPGYGLSIASWIDPDLGHVALGVAVWHGKGEIEDAAGRSLTTLEWLEVVKEPLYQKALFVHAGRLEGIAGGVREFFDTLGESEVSADDLQLAVSLELPDDRDDI